VVGAVVPGELEVPDVEVGDEVEVLCGGVVLVGEGEDVPEPLGAEGAVGSGRLGVETVGVGRLGVETVGVGRFGVEMVGVVSADADGSAAMPTTASTVIAPTTSFRLRNTLFNLLPQAGRSRPPYSGWAQPIRFDQVPFEPKCCPATTPSPRPGNLTQHSSESNRPRGRIKPGESTRHGT
jgi:hypothetical protein